MAARRPIEYLSTRSPHDSIRPLLKWAGGKRQLLPHLRGFYPHRFDRYIEPFLGSGAVFFDLYSTGGLRHRDAILIDSNADLIGCYENVRDRPEAVASALDELAEAHHTGGHRHYYDVRDRQFNPGRERLREVGGRIAYTPQLAAMFIYLNRTGFNGLFRLNARGAFNVPVGRYARPKICDRARLFRVAEALGDSRVSLRHGPFDEAGDIAVGGDFLYIDPPYAPVSRTANFTGYTHDRFDAADQRRLHSTVVSMVRRGCHVLLSNSTAEAITAMYAGDGETIRAGLKAIRIPARRAINCQSAGRGPVDEYLITNIDVKHVEE